MTPARLDTIRANRDFAFHRNDDVSRIYARDVSELLDEVERVRAELEEARAQIADFEDDFHAVISTPCAPDERHCSCVPHLRHALEEARVEQQEDVICTCGLPMSRNPHPDAGKPAALLDVGAVWVCSPCTVQGRHKASRRAAAAEAEIASSQSLMADLHDILDRAGLPPRDGYSLRERVRHAHDGLESLRLTLAAEQGLPIGAPDPAWEPRGGLLRTWWRDYRDGTVGTVRGAPDGSARWWRGEPGILASEDGTESRPPHTIAEGTADSKRAAMQAADAVTL